MWVDPFGLTKLSEVLNWEHQVKFEAIKEIPEQSLRASWPQYYNKFDKLFIPLPKI